MSETHTNGRSSRVLFLGAGASRALGYAVTSEILPEIYLRLKGLKGFSSPLVKENVELLHDLLALFNRSAPVATGPAATITEILSILDYCILHDEVLLSDIDLRLARRVLERAIAEILGGPIHVNARVLAKDVTAWLAHERENGLDVSIISTNYDTSIDLPLIRDVADGKVGQLDLGLSFRRVTSGKIVHPSNKPSLRLYKLHGSLNWLRCPRCTYVYINLISNVASIADRRRGEWNKCHCEHVPLDMLLVTPSYVRHISDPNLRGLWQNAYEALRSAREWTFVGYSLPTEDVAIRAMLLRALLARRSAQLETQVAVYDPDPQVLSRYAGIIPNVSGQTGGFEALVSGEGG